MSESKIVFKNNYLKNVIFRIDFSPILKLQSGLDSQFQESIRDIFPKLEEKLLTKHVITIHKKEKSDITTKALQSTFWNKDKTQKIVIYFEHLIIEFSKYSNYSEFKDIILKIYNSFLEYYAPLDIKRMGFRYINRIKLEKGHPLKWDKYINKSLTGFLDNYWGNKSELSRVLSQSIINKSDHTINLTYGIFNDEFPAPISRKEFILDIDSHTNECEENTVIEKLDLYNDEMVDIFLNSIEKKIKDKMEIEND